MKIIKHIFFGFVLLLMVFGCKKEPFDYRYLYAGDWDFVVETMTYHMDSLPTHTYSLKNEQGEIVLGEAWNEIIIRYSHGGELVTTVNENGKMFYDKPQSSYYYGRFDGNDKVHYRLRSGGIGGGSGVEVTGEKK